MVWQLSKAFAAGSLAGSDPTLSGTTPDACVPPNGTQEINGGCTYGINCGGSCTSDNVWVGGPLDEACHEHDKCLADPAYDQYKSSTSCSVGGQPNCNCDAELARRAWEVGACACTCARCC